MTQQEVWMTVDLISHQRKQNADDKEWGLKVQTCITKNAYFLILCLNPFLFCFCHDHGFSTFVLRTVVVRFNQGEIWKTAFEKCLEQNSSRTVNPFFLQSMIWTQQEVCVWCSSDWRWSFTFVNVHRLLLSILVYTATFRNTVKLATIVFFKKWSFQSYDSWNSLVPKVKYWIQ